MSNNERRFTEMTSGAKNVPENFKSDSYRFSKGLPTRENCDLNNPKEMFLWMFTAMPGINGAPMMLPASYWMLVSEHLYQLGARLSAEPIKHYQPPGATDPDWATSPGRWIPVNQPVVPKGNPAAEALEGLSMPQCAELFRELVKRLSPAQRREILEEST